MWSPYKLSKKTFTLFHDVIFVYNFAQFAAESFQWRYMGREVVLLLVTLLPSDLVKIFCD